MKKSLQGAGVRVALVVLAFLLSALVRAGAAGVQRGVVWLAVGLLALVLVPVGVVAVALAPLRAKTA